MGDFTRQLSELDFPSKDGYCVVSATGILLASSSKKVAMEELAGRLNLPVWETKNFSNSPAKTDGVLCLTPYRLIDIGEDGKLRPSKFFNEHVKNHTSEEEWRKWVFKNISNRWGERDRFLAVKTGESVREKALWVFGEVMKIVNIS